MKKKENTKQRCANISITTKLQSTTRIIKRKRRRRSKIEEISLLALSLLFHYTATASSTPTTTTSMMIQKQIHKSYNANRSIASFITIPSKTKSKQFHLYSSSTTSTNEPSTTNNNNKTPYNLSTIKSIVAPMVGQSDLPFRLLCRSYNVDLAYTQMIHCTNFMRDETFRLNHLDVYTQDQTLKYSDLLESQRLAIQNLDAEQETKYDEKGPIVVQLAGHDPQTILSTAQHILHRTSSNSNLIGFDLNLGCPQGIARKGNYGSFLCDTDPTLVTTILSTLRQNLPSSVFVSAKIRLPEVPTKENIKERIQRLIHDGGVNMIAVHGRTRRENKTLVRECSLDAIRYAVQVAKAETENNNPDNDDDDDVVMIANGGIEYSSDAYKTLEYTGAHAIMSSEGLLENPGLFLEGAKDDVDMTPREIFDRQMKYVRDYLRYAAMYPPLPGSLGKKGGSFNVVRGHLFKMLYRYLEEQPDLRNALADSNMRSIKEVQTRVVDELRRRYEKLGGEDEEKWEGLSSSDLNSSWYRRHRDAISRVHSRDNLSSARVLLGGGGGGTTVEESVEEKKKRMKERILQMKEARKKKERIGGAVGVGHVESVTDATTTGDNDVSSVVEREETAIV